MADVTYRNAGEDDISLILEFIKKLADYEGRLDEVTATEEDLEPAYRGKGYGKGLMKEIAKFIIERGYGRFEWTAVSWNEPAIDFYLSIGAEQMDWELFHLDGDDLKKLANL